MLTTNCIDKVRDAAKVDEYLKTYRNIHLSPVGKELVCLCPIHKEKSPSFTIDPVKNLWHCFGCDRGGDAIHLVREIEGCGFEEAVTILADAFHIPIEEQTEPMSEAERQQALKKELMRNTMDTVQTYYAANLWRKDMPECVEALEYARKRWDDEFIRTHGIGYAINDWQDLVKFANSKGISSSLLVDLGLAKQNDRGGYYDFFRGRITIPIRNRSNRIIAYTARVTLDNNKDNTPKYLHNSNTEIFVKDETVFGIHSAAGAAARADKCYLVEGAPDVLRLNVLGINNAAACLGADWTDTQLSIIKKSTSVICFIPDADVPKSQTIISALDRYGTGINKVVKAGKAAFMKGFHVLVKEIPLGKRKVPNTDRTEDVKADPDSYFTTLDKFSSLSEEDFIVWYADKIIDKSQATSVNNTAMMEIASLVCRVEIDSEISLYIEKLNSILPGKSAWKKAIDDARTQRTHQDLSKDGKRFSDLKEYGFMECNHTYQTTTKGGHLSKWSNFVLEPLFHVRGLNSAIRLFRITNEDNVSMIVEFKQEDLSTLPKFRNKVECLGNFVWLAKEDQLISLKTYLYRETESADLITQLGWQKKGFFAFGNGIYFQNRWYPVDKQGIVRLPDKGTYYLPAFSEVYENDQEDTYAFERTFVHMDYNSISMYDFVRKMVTVFGESAMVAIAFLYASLFRDIVTFETKTFPVLNLFGQHGSGKSELCHSLMSFFIIDNLPVSLRTSTLPSIAVAVGQCANALVHLDEFKNDIDPEKIEFLKGLWDGVGRNKVNVDRNNRRETSRVNAGVLVSGQEISSKDPALLSRFILLPFGRNTFSALEQKRYDDLKSTRKRGCSHLTLQILRYRHEFEQSFRYKYRQISKELAEELAGKVESRIMGNWVIPLAAFQTLEHLIEVPFSYDDLYATCVRLLIEQSDKSRNSNDMAKFWKAFATLVSKGKLFDCADYRIKFKSWVRIEVAPKQTVKRNLGHNTLLLVFNYNRVYDEYDSYCYKHHYEPISKESLQQYLECAPNYLGKIASQRFTRMINGVIQYKIPPSEKHPKGTPAEDVLDAYCFDYQKTRDLYDGFSLPSQTLTNYYRKHKEELQIDEDLDENEEPETETEAEAEEEQSTTSNEESV